jgi:uncharacterized protein (DUF488 family)
LEDFVARLRRHEVQAVADVRRTPYSRRHPQYNREPLAATLGAVGIAYQHYEALGGMRDVDPASPHRDLPESVRGFADHMGSHEFGVALDTLVRAAATRRTAILCAEALPEHCHRRLIADALVARGVAVEHVLDAETRKPHRLTAGVELLGDRLVYSGFQRMLDFEAS